MGFEGTDPEQSNRIKAGLLLLGWRADNRLTSDDGLMIEEVAEEALALDVSDGLSQAKVDDLALRAFDILQFQVMNVDERTLMATGPYSESQYLKPMVGLIDEATLCYYRGYSTAALATLFVALEWHLRSLYGWQPGDQNPSFADLRGAVNRLADSEFRTEAAAILNVIYARYDSTQPPPFHFNRHGLLHGLRSGLRVDRLNTVRMFLLLDVLCFAEGLSRGIEMSDEFTNRKQVYLECVDLAKERILLGKHANHK